MALQTGITFRGKIENVVGYVRYGKPFMRMARGVRPSVAMKKRSANFGMASRAGSALRPMLEKSIPYPKDRKMQLRFSGAISRWLGQRELAEITPQIGLHPIQRFDFNPDCYALDSWKIELLLEIFPDHIEINLPAFTPRDQIKLPDHTKSLKLIFSTACINLLQPGGLNGGIKEMVIPYTDEVLEACSWRLPLSVKTGHLLITALGVASDPIIEQTKYRPGRVIDARYL